MTQRVHASVLRKELVTQFPEIKVRFRDYAAGLHMEMSAFCSLTQEAINRGDMEAAAAHFRVADWAIREGNRQVRGAMCVSYLEDLDLRSMRGQRAFELMPAALRTAWRQTHEYLEQLFDKTDPKGQLGILPKRFRKNVRKG